LSLIDDDSGAIATGRASYSLSISGVVLTSLWLIAAGIYCHSRWDVLVELKPDAVANFAAGVCAPLAFLWLVLGFFQQGQELRNSGRALWLQGRELQQSVEQQRELVNVTREQLHFESSKLERQQDETVRNAQPILRLAEGGSSGAVDGGRSHEFTLSNLGRPCTDIRVIDADGKSRIARPILDTGGSLSFQFDFAFGPVPPFQLSLAYVDQQLIARQKIFTIKRDTNSFQIEEAN
jgi:hypothetical protein